LGKKTGSTLIGGEVLAFEGSLGAGKTTFIQGLAEGIGIKNKIVSPTFILMRSYNNFYHLDLYRLEGEVEKEVRNLGLFDIWENPKNIVAIEWAEKIKNIMPAKTIWIKFKNIDNERRSIDITY